MKKRIISLIIFMCLLIIIPTSIWAVTGGGTAKTIAAVAKADDPVIEVTAAGIGVKEDAVIDCGTYA